MLELCRAASTSRSVLLKSMRMRLKLASLLIRNNFSVSAMRYSTQRPWFFTDRQKVEGSSEVFIEYRHFWVKQGETNMRRPIGVNAVHHITLFTKWSNQNLCSFRRDTCYKDVHHSIWIPLKAHRVAKHWLLGRLRRPALANQCRRKARVNVAWQSLKFAVWVFDFNFQQIATAMGTIGTLHHVNHADQCEQAAGRQVNTVTFSRFKATTC